MIFEVIKKNREVLAFLEKGNENLGVLGYTDHSVAHCALVAERAGDILKTLGYGEKEIELARQLAQKSYNEKILRYAEKTYIKISGLLKDYEDDKMEQILFSEHPERQKLISPVEATFQQKLEYWKSQPYECKAFSEDAPVIMTNKGLRVRSKSEKIMADYFESISLAFKYECPLYLEPYGIIYPDFTFLSRRTGKEVYWEHEGMLDNPEYARSAVKKIELYEMNGIYPGDALILTFETSVSVIRTDIMKNLTKKYLL